MPNKKQQTNPDHSASVVALRRIEGQIQGVQRMIEQRRYCVDILTQLNSVVGAILRVEDDILKKHLSHCVHDALTYGSDLEKERKTQEILELLRKFRKCR